MSEIDSADQDLREAVGRILPSVRADLEALVRVPSVSADGFDQEHVRRCAELTAQMLGAAGLEQVDIVDVPGGRPAVVGHRAAPAGAPTVLLYAHHDVQPPGARADWSSEPFEPTERNGRLYGRGAADDKAGIAVHLAALRAHAGRLPVGVRVLIEGEEEIGSPTLPQFLAAHRDAVAADVMVLADSMNWAVGRPALTTSLRGLVDCVVEVRTLHHGVHSGLYGGPVPDALSALVRLLATLHHEDGNVAVPGLVSGDASPGAGQLDLTEARLRADAGVVEGVRLLGSGPLTGRLWNKPAVSVLAVDAPSIAQASNTLLPVARAKVSLRVAPGDHARGALRALAEHLETNAPWGARVRVVEGTAGEPFAADATGYAYDAARRAFAEAWGVEPVDMGMGGSIPFIAAFVEIFPEAQILVTGVEDPDSRAHGADESLHLDEFARACLAEALLLHELRPGDRAGGFGRTAR